MLFTELRFLPFFALVFGVHWGLRSARLRKAWLLAASYAFYAAWDWRFLGLIVGSTLVDYLVGLRLDRAPGGAADTGGIRRTRRAWITLSVAVNLGLLGFFKYFHFFVDSALELCAALGVEAHAPTLRVILPVGISFYTFQTMSYSLDVYRGRLRATRSLLDLATFVAFFPQLVAGPIVRAAHFLPQLTTPRRFAEVNLRFALGLFVLGFVKKACVSDNLAPVVDAYFAAPWDYDAFSAWAGVLYYTIQIYCDFSGYSDMAIACAALLGYRLPTNFDAPYLARSITEFWRRWHISLSTWLRDYLYIPLGGNRGGLLATYRNLMLTMLLGGLWHGTAWSFVLWGALHGAALVVHREWSRRVPAGSALRRGAGLLGWPVTLWLVCLAWIPFRATGMQEALEVLRAFVLFDAQGTERIGGPFPWVVTGLFAVHLMARAQAPRRLWFASPAWAASALLGVAVGLILPFVSIEFPPFLYFQF